VATLLGATIEPPSFQLHPSTTVTVTLAWQAEAETALSYRVFLHLVREDGQLIAQSDGEPANWTRPTTGWLIGEVVMDERVLRIPADTRAGEYVLLCGLYNLDTLERLSTTDGTEAIPVARLVVDPP